MSSSKIFTLAVFIGLSIYAQDGICQKQAPAESIVQKTTAAYAKITSYQDTGVVDEVDKEDPDRRNTMVWFKTYYVRPQFFRFEWKDIRLRDPEKNISVIWSDGFNSYHFYGWAGPSPERDENIYMTISGATAISRGAARHIPAVLFHQQEKNWLETADKLSIVAEETFEGEDCYVIRVEYTKRSSTDVWISKRDHLLRKVVSEKTNSYWVDIRREIVLNADIPAETFSFTPPASVQPSAVKQETLPGSKTCFGIIIFMAMISLIVLGRSSAAGPSKSFRSRIF